MACNQHGKIASYHTGLLYQIKYMQQSLRQTQQDHRLKLTTIKKSHGTELRHVGIEIGTS